MIFSKNTTKKIFTAILGLSLVLPFFSFAEVNQDELLDPFKGQNLSRDTGDSMLPDLGGVFTVLSTPGGQLVPIDLSLGTIRDVANKIAWSVAKLLVHKITDQIVQLIRTGGQGGGPLFVQDWHGFLLDAADQASGVFLKELNLTQLCQPFAPRLRLIFGQGRQSLMQRYSCTISGVLQNFENFFNDFNNGGWQRWIELTNGPGNPYTTFLGLAAEKETREGSASGASLNEALSGNGFLGIEDCGNLTPAEREDRERGGLKACPTVSPGKYLEDRLAKATNSDIEQLNLADSFNEILMAAFQSLINGIFFAPGGLQSSDINSTTIQNQLQQDLDNLKKSEIQFSQIDLAIITTQSIIDKETNSLAKIKDEIQTLQSLKICQQAKLLPTNTTENEITAATSTKQTLETGIANNNLLLVLLKEDRKDMLAAQTVDALNAALATTQNDTAKVGPLAAAAAQNDQITADKTKAEEDLQACLNPPKPSS